MTGASIAQVEGILGGLQGVRAVGRLSPDARREVARIESEYEAAGALPVHNVGVRLAAERAEAFAILKDVSFRPPGMPTVYLVEEEPVDSASRGGQGPDSLRLVVEGRGYRVIGEELYAGREAGTSHGPPPLLDAVYLADTFAMFPERRTGTGVPCFFLLPPIPFPELECRQQELGIRHILSVSPSLAVDMYLRGLFGFARTNDLATILVGFDTVP